MARILIHSLVFSPDGVSTAYLYTDLAVELKKLGHSVSVLTTTPHFNVLPGSSVRQPLQRKLGRWLYYSECEGIPVWHIAMPQKSSDVSTRLLNMVVFHLGAILFSLGNAQKYDVVLSPSPPLTIGAVSWLVAKRHRAKAIYNVQEIYPDFAIKLGLIRNPAMIWGLKKLESFVYEKSDRIVVIGEKFRDIILARSVSADKVITIPNSVDLGLYYPLQRDNAFAREHGLVGRFVVMYAGNIGFFQHWEPMLFAAQTLGPKVLFVVIGNGVRRDWLAGEISRRSLKNVLLLDYQPRERMAEINASCDVATILMDSKVADEGFPSKILTTMACDKPTIVYCPERSELVRIVRESGCGRWVHDGKMEEYCEAVRTYQDDPLRRETEGALGRAFVEKRYSRQIVARHYHEMIKDLVGSPIRSKRQKGHQW